MVKNPSIILVLLIFDLVQEKTTMQNQLMVAIFVALGVMLVAGLVVIPAINEAQARSDTALTNNKGQQGVIKSKGNCHGCHGINT
jgi:mono/diheme cytochrome c family protein